MGKGKRVLTKESNKKRRLTREEVEIKKGKIKRCFLTILAIIILTIIAMIVNDFVIIDNNKTTNLIINNKS